MGLRNKSLKWNEEFEIKQLKVSLLKDEAMISSGIRMTCLKGKPTDEGSAA